MKQFLLLNYRLLRIGVPIVLVLIGTMMLASSSVAQSADFSDGIFAEPTSHAPIAASEVAIRSRAVQIDVGQLTGQRRAATASRDVTLNLFEDIVVHMQKTGGYENASGSLTWIGEVANIPASTVIFVIRDGSVYGAIELPRVGNFSIQPISADIHQIAHVREDATLSGETDVRIPDLSEKKALTADNRAITASDDGSIIDVYVAYDNDASGGSVAAADAQSYAELFIAYTNTAYANSGIAQRVWLTGAVEGYAYTDPVTNDEPNLNQLNADLDNVTPGGDGTDIAGLLAKRDEYHADLVLFFVPFVGDSCGGLAWLQTTNNDLSWEDKGYSVMEACSIGQNVFAHELGHNMGSRHDWYMDAGTTPNTTAHGYVDTINEFRTIMAYNNRCEALGKDCPRIAHFSSATVTYNGHATGVASGTATTCSDDTDGGTNGSNDGDPNPAQECDADNVSNFNSKSVTTSQFRSSQLTWTGNANSDWSNAANWTIAEGVPGATTATNRVPRSFDSILIPSGLGTYPTISSGSVTAREIMIANGATLNMTGGTLAVGWRWEDSGGFNPTGGTVQFNGPIDITVTSTSAFKNVQISSKTTLNSNLNVDGNLQVDAGATFVAGANTINVAGNWSEGDATGFTAGTSTVIFDGTAQTVDKVTTASVLSEDFSAYNDTCCTSGKPTGWANSNGSYLQGDLLVGDNGAANRWRNQTDGYLYTPEVVLTAGVVYELQYDVATRRNFSDGDGSLSPQTVSVHLGSAQSAAGMTTILSAEASETATSYQTRTISNITVATSGTYYIGFRAQQTGDDYTIFDNISLNGVANINFYNVEVASGVTTFNNSVAIASNLSTASGAVANFGTHAVMVEGAITNNGGLKQTKTVVNGAMSEFGRIQNAAASTDKYYGVELTPSTGDMGSTTVEIQGNQTCANISPANGGVQRCYIVTPATNQTASAKLYYDAGEENGNANPTVYLLAGAAWNPQTTHSRGGSGNGVWATADSLTAYGSFALATETPTAVVLESFNVTDQADGTVQIVWETASEINHAGFNIYRRAANSRSAWSQINTALIASAGIQAQGAVYQMVDTTVSAGRWDYLLEDVDLNGETFQHVDAVDSAEIQATTVISLTNQTTSRVSITLYLLLFIGLLMITRTAYYYEK